ncbi:hypothetical protein HKX42_02040 [Salinisphaera sp. USBA-960]|uniref:metallophosphoesterase n=1 Tax=Salinisphaera orenii TaxID=856731 RepID=UPI000DBE3A7E|nr:hypothetical protein [Salifodinibacter halophilus]NNC25656.1 hypothetical protein [Salifodinibacter halophilus]
MTDLIHYFAANGIGRDFVVGDIHGCFSVFERALAKLEFEPTRDRVFCVGDLVDRGPESPRAFEFATADWFFTVRGNHEQMGVAAEAGGPEQTDARKHWYMNGGDWFDTLASDERARFVSLFDALPYLIEVELVDGQRAAIVHADVVEDDWWATRALVAREPGPAALADLVWSRDRVALLSADECAERGSIAVTGTDVIYFGHTPLNSPMASANTRWIDTGAVFGNALTIAELGPRGDVWAFDRETGDMTIGWITV